jgi:hypothetical protein
LSPSKASSREPYGGYCRTRGRSLPFQRNCKNEYT